MSGAVFSPLLAASCVLVLAFRDACNRQKVALQARIVQMRTGAGTPLTRARNHLTSRAMATLDTRRGALFCKNENIKMAVNVFSLIGN